MGGIFDFPAGGSRRRARVDGMPGEPFEIGEGRRSSESPLPKKKKRRRRKASPGPLDVLARSAGHGVGSCPSPAEILARSLDNVFTESAPPKRPAKKRRRRVEQAPEAPRASSKTGADPFWPVWAEHKDYLHKLSLRFMAGNQADAEDALSTAMISGHKHFVAGKILNERAWLARLVHNACMDQYRKQKRQSDWTEETVVEDAFAALTALTPAPSQLPEDRFHDKEMILHLEAHLLCLPVGLLEPLLMRFLEDLSYDDIAGRLNLTNCTVRKRIQLAREQLKSSGVFDHVFGAGKRPKARGR